MGKASGLSSDECAVKVSPYLRIVPSGFIKQGGKEILRLVALFSPDGVKHESSKGQIDIEKWPSELIKSIQSGFPDHAKKPVKWTIPLQVFDANTGAKCGNPIYAKASRLEHVYKPDVKLADKVDEYWLKSFKSEMIGAEVPWSELICHVTESLAGSRISAGDRFVNTSSAKGRGADELNAFDSDDEFGTAGQLKFDPTDARKPKKIIESIIPNPHGGLALGLEWQRASELKTSMTVALGSTNAYVDEEEQRYEKLRLRKATPYGGRLTKGEAYYQDGTCIAGKPLSPRDAKKCKKIGQYKAVLGSTNEIRKKGFAEFGNHKKLFSGDFKGYRATLSEVDRFSERGDLQKFEQRENSIDNDLAAFSLSTWPQYSDLQEVERLQETGDTENCLDRASRLFFTMQTTQSVSRLFALAVDVEIERSDLEQALKDASTMSRRKEEGGYSSYFLLGSPLNEDRKDARLPARTLSKFRKEPSGDVHFWPATTEEFQAHKSNLGSEDLFKYLPQYDGLLAMGGQYGCDSNSVGEMRFDLTSIDIRTAAEVETQRRLNRDNQWLYAISAAGDADGGGANEADQLLARKLATEQQGHLRSSYQTAGLVLLDRGAQVGAVRKLASRHDKDESGGPPRNHVELDADDLTIGHHLYVGVPRKGASNGQLLTTSIWRPVDNRVVEFGTSGVENVGPGVKRLLEKLLGDADDDLRLELDRSVLGSQSRMMPSQYKSKEDKAGNVGQFEVIVDEAIGQWSGDPMGVDTAIVENSQSGTGQMEALEDVFAFGRTLRLPQRGKSKNSQLSIRQRYGVPYRFALVTKFAGGYSISPQSINEKDSQVQGKACYPSVSPDCANPHFRFLRQNRIDAPQVLLPRGIAEKVHGAMGPEEAGVILVRSVLDSQSAQQQDKVGVTRKERARPKETYRVVLPPATKYEELIRHGVFDKDSRNKPKGCLLQFAYDTEKAQFPAVKSRRLKGFDSHYFFKSREVVSNPKDELPNDEYSIGDSVLTVKGGWNRRGYFADPMAEYLAFGLRIPGEDEYIDDMAGSNEVVVRMMHGIEHQDAKPLAIRVVAVDGGSCERHRALSDIVVPKKKLSVPMDDTPFFFDGVDIALEPGESYELDMWCVPTKEALAKNFSVLQSLAILLACPDRKSKICSDDDTIEGLAKAIRKYDEQLADELIALKGKPADPPFKRFVGPGGFVVPSKWVLEKVAEVVEMLLRKRPLPEISCKRTVRIAHAVNRPVAEPLLSGPQARGECHFRTAGMLPDSVTNDPSLKITRVGSSLKDGSGSCSGESSELLISEGTESYTIHGKLTLDLDRVDSFELVARTVLPGSSLFDDSSRGRSLKDRRKGSWPCRPGSESEHLDAERIFGFACRKDGVVYHRTVDVTLLRVEGLPTSQSAGDLIAQGYATMGQRGCVVLNLERFFEAEVDDSKNRWRVTRRHVFPDGKARLLEIEPKVFSRTLDFMSTIRRVAQNPDLYEFLPKEPVPPEISFTAGSAKAALLPSTARPAMIKLDRSPSVSFEYKKTPVQGQSAVLQESISRICRVRIYLGREWFSCGMFERVGCVVWPPNLQLQDSEKLRNDVVRMSSDRPDEVYMGKPWKNPAAQLDFSDEDLGPGGRFVTRIGADPVRGTCFDVKNDGKEAPPSVFIPLESFNDVSFEPSVNNDLCEQAYYEPMVEMPIPQSAEGSESDPAKLGAKMSVGLVHYEPRFDPDLQEWFIEVSVDPGILPEPFIRFGLVRFNKYTRDDLKVSYPVEVRAPLMNRREATVYLSGESLVVRVEGTAGLSVKSVLGNEVEKNQGIPKMRMQMIAESSGDQGFTLRETAYKEVEVSGQQNPSGKVHECTWEHRFSIADINSFDAEKIYRVGVVEVDLRRPSEYPIEPLSPEEIVNDDYSTNSGPRSAFNIDVTDHVRELMATRQK